MSDRIEKSWQEFISFTYQEVDPKSEQMRQLKACWFAAHIEINGILNELSQMMDAGRGAEFLTGLDNEAKSFIMNYVREEKARQGVVN